MVARPTIPASLGDTIPPEAQAAISAHIASLEHIPEPRLERHRYRRHVYRCPCCQRACQGRGDPERPGSHIGPRARLLTCYGRAHLGIALRKTRDLLHDFLGLTISRAGLLGHLRWGGQLFAPAVDELQELLHRSPVVQGNETDWWIDGRPAGPGASAIDHTPNMISQRRSAR